MRRVATWMDYAVVCVSLYLSFFHFRGTMIGILLGVSALLLAFYIKQNS